MTTKPENTQQQADDEVLESNTQTVTGELSDAQLERVAAGSTPTSRAPSNPKITLN